ncbi:MAG TPA: ClpXP protease specificity-enhancing factor, partial [Cupriavidus sp.]|nr:ClpXP protease specificity-enhancing factor [Cupriavidus sp.]
QAATERENNPPPKLASVDSDTPAPVTAEEGVSPDDDPTPPPVPRIGGKKPSLKVVK